MFLCIMERIVIKVGIIIFKYTRFETIQVRSYNYLVIFASDVFWVGPEIRQK